jgi:hypothetical protein
MFPLLSVREISNHLCAYKRAPFMATKQSPCAEQVSGHDFSVLPDARAREQGERSRAEKTSRKDLFLAPQARAQRSGARINYGQLRSSLTTKIANIPMYFLALLLFHMISGRSPHHSPHPR